MAAHIVASGNNLHRTTNIVSGSSAFTVMFWFCQTAGALTGASIFTAANGTPGTNTYTKYAILYNNAGQWTAEVSDGSVTDDLFYTQQNVLLGVWKHLTYTRTAGGVHTFYVNGLPVVAPSSVTLSLAAAGLNFVLLGDDGGAVGETILLSNYREWNVALTQAQINAELASNGTVVHTSGLVAFTPLTSNGNDTSGNANNWSATGTVTYVADPVFPANYCPNTATVIATLPNSTTESLQVTAGQAASGFFSYAGLATDTAISVFPFGVLGAFAPLGVSYNPAGVNINFSQGNKPLFFVVEPGTAGQSYLIETIPAGTLTTPTVVLKTARFASSSPTVGAIAIPATATFNDGYPVPLTLLSPSSATIQSLVLGFPSGGLAGAPGVGLAQILPNGTLLVTLGSTTLQLYTAAYQLIASVTSPGNIQAIGSDNATTFYVAYASAGHVKVKALSQSGVLGSTTYDLGAISFVTSIGANSTNTILYYKNGSTKVSKWDLVNNASLGDLITSVTFHTPMLVLQDNSIVFGNSVNTFGRYNGTTGALINTITNANAVNFAGSDVLAVDLDATSFTQWQTNTGAQAVVQYTSSNGALISNVAWPVFAGGTSSAAASATPTLFGPDPTCPIWVTRQLFTPSVIVGTLQTIPIRRLRRTTQLVDELAWQFFGEFQVMFQPGVGATNNPGANPQICLRWSNDGGSTWSNEHWVFAGQLGQYQTRAIWRQLGRARNRVWEISVSDPVAWAFVDAYVSVQGAAGKTS